MQLIAALALLPLLALAAPATPAPAKADAPAVLRKACRTTGSDVVYHQGPTLGSTNLGQLGAKGTWFRAVCYTVGDEVGTGKQADERWILMGNGGWITNYYVEDSCIDNQDIAWCELD